MARRLLISNNSANLLMLLAGLAIFSCENKNDQSLTLKNEIIEGMPDSLLEYRILNPGLSFAEYGDSSVVRAVGFFSDISYEIASKSLIKLDFGKPSFGKFLLNIEILKQYPYKYEIILDIALDENNFVIPKNWRDNIEKSNLIIEKATEGYKLKIEFVYKIQPIIFGTIYDGCLQISDDVYLKDTLGVLK